MVPFGLAQALAYFQLLMNKVLEGLSYAMTYLDDIIICSKNEEDHLRHLGEVFHQLRQAGLKIKCSKCDFFKSEILSYAMTYLDDIIICSKNEEDHLRHLGEVFHQLRQAGLKIKCSKCDFFKSEIHYLGHLISAHGISPLPEKLDTIKNMPTLKDVKKIKQFLGLTGYYRKFVPRFVDISRPLTQLTKKEMKFVWTPEC